MQIHIYQGAGYGNDIPALLACVGMSDSIEKQEHDEGKSKKVEVKRSEEKVWMANGIVNLNQLSSKL